MYVCVCVFYYIYIFSQKGEIKKNIIFILPSFSQLKREQSSEKTLIKDTSLTAKKNNMEKSTYTKEAWFEVFLYMHFIRI